MKQLKDLKVAKTHGFTLPSQLALAWCNQVWGYLNHHRGYYDGATKENVAAFSKPLSEDPFDINTVLALPCSILSIGSAGLLSSAYLG